MGFFERPIARVFAVGLVTASTTGCSCEESPAARVTAGKADAGSPDAAEAGRPDAVTGVDHEASADARPAPAATQGTCKPAALARIYGGGPKGSLLSQEGVLGATGDSTGGVVLVGAFEGKIDFGGGSLDAGPNRAMFVVGFDAQGKHAYSRRFGDTNVGILTSASAVGLAVAARPAGGVVVGGRFSGTADFGKGPLDAVGSPGTELEFAL